ncbi:vitamin K epoxide reductase family protein [Candidatus Nomurabacteria bacterium]|nr:vitamin K epoxide reductase family protein [Candidatus Nomurabacteria bacterium]
MLFFGDIFWQIIILILGLCGFMVARHIHQHKKINAAPLVCPIGFDCNAVVHSDYSRFFGVPVEIFGMIYYVIISLSYLLFIFVPNIPNALQLNLVALLILISLLAFLFSSYLIGVQVFILKKGCSWCIVSAFICLFIFILTALTYDFSSIGQIFVK